MHAFIRKIFTGVCHVPGRVLSVFLPGTMWKLRHRDKLICPRLHSSYVPEPLFEPRQSRFTRQFQVLARWHPGPATWEAAAPACTEQTLLTPYSYWCVLTMWTLRMRHKAELLTLPRPAHPWPWFPHSPILSTVRSPWPEFLFPLCSHCIWCLLFITPHYDHSGVPSWEGNTVQGLRSQAT